MRTRTRIAAGALLSVILAGAGLPAASGVGLPAAAGVGAPGAARVSVAVAVVPTRASAGAAQPAAVTAVNPLAHLSLTSTVRPSGKVRLEIRSNAKQVKVKYRTARNSARTKVVRLSKRTYVAAVKLPKGSQRITVRTLPTSRLAASPTLPVGLGGAVPVSPDGVAGAASTAPVASCKALDNLAEDSRLVLTLGCATASYTANPILGIRVYAYVDAGHTQMAPAMANPVDLLGGTTSTFEGLANNTTYYFATAAYDQAGEGERVALGNNASGVRPYRHHLPSYPNPAQQTGPKTVELTWVNDPLDLEPITSVIITAVHGIQVCGSADCPGARRIVQDPATGPDWATRYVGSDFRSGTWCFRVWPVDVNGVGTPSINDCLTIS